MGAYILIMVFSTHYTGNTQAVTSINQEFYTEVNCVKAANALNKQLSKNGTVLAVQCTQR